MGDTYCTGCWKERREGGRYRNSSSELADPKLGSRHVIRASDLLKLINSLLHV